MFQAIKSHDTLSENIKIFYYHGIQYLDQSNVCQFTQTIPFHARTIKPKNKPKKKSILGQMSNLEPH